MGSLAPALHNAGVTSQVRTKHQRSATECQLKVIIVEAAKRNLYDKYYPYEKLLPPLTLSNMTEQHSFGDIPRYMKI